MLIRPFEPIKTTSTGPGCINIRTDISYIPAYAESRGRLVVSKKYLLNNFSSKKSNTFVKVVYVMWHNCKTPINNKNDLSRIPIGDLFLRYVTTALYDSEKDHYFGNLIYDTTTQSQCINTIFDVKPTVKLENIMYNVYFAEILKDNTDGEIEFYLLRGLSKTYQPMSGYMLRKVRKIDEFIYNANVHFTSYSGEFLNKLDTFSNQNIKLVAKQSTWLQDAFGPYNDKMLETQIKKEICDRLIGDMTKANLMSLVDEATLVYSKGKITIANIRYPFDKVVVGHITQVEETYTKELLAAIKPAIATLGDISFVVQLSDAVSIGSMNIKDINANDNIKSVSFSDQSIDNYIFENLKSKRYRRKHHSYLEIEQERIQEEFDDVF